MTYQEIINFVKPRAKADGSWDNVLRGIDETKVSPSLKPGYDVQVVRLMLMKWIADYNSAEDTRDPFDNYDHAIHVYLLAIIDSY